MAAEDGQGLIDAMLFVEIGFLNFAALEELDDPARVEIDAEGDAAAMLGEMLDGQAQPARAGGAEHEPVGSLGEGLVGERVAEILVIDAEIVDLKAALGDAGRTAGLEDVDRLARQPLGQPPAHRAAAKPVIFEVGQFPEVGIAVDFLARVDAGLLLPSRARRGSRFPD